MRAIGGGVTVHRADGSPVPADHETSLDGYSLVVRPHSPWIAGERYTVRLSSMCSSGPGPCRESSFTATAAAAVPERIDGFSLANTGHGNVKAGDPGQCAQEITAAWAAFRLEPGTLSPWLRVTAWELSVDGMRWAIEEAGAVGADGLLEPGSSYTPVERRRILLVHASCGGLTSADRGLTTGRHPAVLSAQIAGGAKIVSPIVDFELACNGGIEDPPPVVGAARPLLDSAPLCAENVSTGGDTGGATPGTATDPVRSTSGCSSAGGTPAVWMLLALGVIALGRGSRHAPAFVKARRPPVTPRTGGDDEHASSVGDSGTC
ncbi:hypothetical protein [Anaeromyxobacter soli]|uniref:hypothetical protein n=1 Tax=Anaeromyxobacter soli TaxID=2922725 RepID=UPI001FAF5B28|nr:hypothetical protein [Anaeromyxobacter sp. SG29]